MKVASVFCVAASALALVPALAGTQQAGKAQQARPAEPRESENAAAAADPFARPLPEARTWQAIVQAADAADLPAGDEVNLDSSTSAQPIAAATFCALHGLPLKWTQSGWTGEARLIPDVPDPQPDERIRQYRLPATSGTHAAYLQLIEGDTDLTFEARKPSEDELKLMEEKGVELERKPLARDAFVFIVNHQNKVEGLTLEQVHDIYTGKITKWDQVGGADLPIHAYQRNRNSGSQVLMERLVMKGAEMIEPRAMTHRSMIGPINAMNRDPLGLGFTVHYYERFMAPPDDSRRGLRIKNDKGAQPEEPPTRLRRMLAIDGVEPTPQAIADGQYPLTCPVYIVIRKQTPADSPARRLRDWLLTPDGQNLIAAIGYVPLKRSHDHP
ncbi:MAG: hypothetical protein GVY24_01035 [Planctomycetes bacterium]|nr:hypothetical protein [Planctomycetota bacterium]